LNAKGKRVGVPVYTCSSLRNAVDLIGGEIVYIDNAPNSVNIDINSVNKIKPDIVIIPHTYGIPVDISMIDEDILVIEDCAQALGSKMNGIMSGLLGDVSIFSFYSTKLITSGGQGGMVVSKNKDIIDKIKDYREFDCRKDNKSRFNFQMTDLQASIGLSQLKKLPSFLKTRNEIWLKYKFERWDLIDDGIIEELMYVNKSVKFRAVLNTNKPKEIINKLNNVGIKCIVPIEDWELLSDEYDKFPNAYSLSKSTVSIPLYPSLTEDDVNNIIYEVNKVVWEKVH
jgi:perosamine synthetase